MELLLDALKGNLFALEERKRGDATAAASGCAPSTGTAPGCGELLPSNNRSVQDRLHALSTLFVQSAKSMHGLKMTSHDWDLVYNAVPDRNDHPILKLPHAMR